MEPRQKVKVSNLPFQQTIKRIVIPCLFAAVATIIFAWQTKSVALTHDFLNLYSAASLARDGRVRDIYDPKALFQREREVAPEATEITVFSRPPLYAVLLMPLSLAPYQKAYYLWVAGQAALLVACWIWAVRRFGDKAIAHTCLYIPPMLGIAHGQDCAVIPILLIAAYSLSKRNLPFASGLALGIGLFKFHLFVLWPLCLVAQRKWRMLAGFIVMGTVELIASLHLAGWSGVHSYIQLLGSSGSEALHPAPEKVVSLWGLLANIGVTTPAVAIVCAIACAICMAVFSRNGGLEQLFSVATAGSLVIAPHVYLYDAAALLLPLWLALFLCSDQWTRKAALLFAKPHIFAVFLLLWPPFIALPAAVLLAFAVLAARSDTASWGSASVSGPTSP